MRPQATYRPYARPRYDSSAGNSLRIRSRSPTTVSVVELARGANIHSRNSMEWPKTNILVTGGTGSFGKKFAEILLRECAPQKLIIFSRGELKQHEMRLAGFDHPSLRYFIG